MTIDDNMKVILQDWADRGRLHRGPIVINQLFQRLKREYSFSVDREAFEQYLLTLENSRLIIISRGNKGALLSFTAAKGDIITTAKALGFVPKTEAALNRKVPPPNTILAREDKTIESRVIVLFTVKGLRCRAEVPESAINEFEKMLKA